MKITINDLTPLTDLVYTQAIVQASREVYDQVTLQIRDQVNDQVSGPIWGHGRDKIWDQLVNNINENFNK